MTSLLRPRLAAGATRRAALLAVGEARARPRDGAGGAAGVATAGVGQTLAPPPRHVNVPARTRPRPAPPPPDRAADARRRGWSWPRATLGPAPAAAHLAGPPPPASTPGRPPSARPAPPRPALRRQIPHRGETRDPPSGASHKWELPPSLLGTARALARRDPAASPGPQRTRGGGTRVGGGALATAARRCGVRVRFAHAAPPLAARKRMV